MPTLSSRSGNDPDHSPLFIFCVGSIELHDLLDATDDVLKNNGGMKDKLLHLKEEVGYSLHQGIIFDFQEFAEKLGKDSDLKDLQQLIDELRMLSVHQSLIPVLEQPKNRKTSFDSDEEQEILLEQMEMDLQQLQLLESIDRL